MKRPHKYRAKPTVVDGVRFASQAEANYYLTLKMLEKAGQVRDIELQPSFHLHVNGVRIGQYRGDFRYYDKALDKTVVAEVKGIDLPLGRWKRRHAEAEHGIEIVMVWAKKIRR